MSILDKQGCALQFTEIILAYFEEAIGKKEALTKIGRENFNLGVKVL